LSASANKLAHNYPKLNISYLNLDKMSERGTPEMMCKYKLALTLKRTFDNNFPMKEWVAIPEL
jgi:hypothetical protein